MEFTEQDKVVFDDMMAFLKQYPEFENLETVSNPVLSLSGLEINFGSRKVTCNGRNVELTAKEYEILRLLIVNKGRVLTYSQIYSKVWGDTALGNESKAVGYHIWNIRKKLCESSDSPPIVIESVREVGYQLEDKS